MDAPDTALSLLHKPETSGRKAWPQTILRDLFSCLYDLLFHSLKQEEQEEEKEKQKAQASAAHKKRVREMQLFSLM